MNFNSRHFLMAAALLTAGTCAHAQFMDSVNLPNSGGEGGEGRVGAAVIAGYKYLGSDERRWVAFPGIDYRWANGWFAGFSTGVGYQFKSDPQWQYGLRMAVDLGREEDRSSALRGLGNINPRPEAGAFLNWQASPSLTLTSSVRYGAGNDRHGLVVDVGARHGLQLAPQWHLGFSVGATYVNRDYMQSYFGITPEQSANSGYAVSQVSAGLRDVRAGVSLTHIINREWAATLGVNATSLQGDAKDAAIVRERTPITGMLGIGYRF
jgi:outer membrane scaffolding protein for murein synthesis (MipA/OmpV family)